MKIVKATLKDGTPVLGKPEAKTGTPYPATYANDEQAEEAAAAARAAGFPNAHVRRSTLTAVVRYVVLAEENHDHGDDSGGTGGSRADQSGKIRVRK